MSKRTRIVIVDDHPLVLAGLARILSVSDELEVVATATSGLQALQQLKALQVDVLMTDLDMPKMSGLELVKQARELFPELHVLVLSVHNDPTLIKALMQAGANGFVVKTAPGEEILRAVQSVAQGTPFYSADVTDALLRQHTETNVQSGPKLSERELEVLQLVASGYSTKEISEKLFISVRTVETHRLNMMKKLDVKNVAGLIRYGLKHGLVD